MDCMQPQNVAKATCVSSEETNWKGFAGVWGKLNVCFPLTYSFRVAHVYELYLNNIFRLLNEQFPAQEQSYRLWELNHEPVGGGGVMSFLMQTHFFQSWFNVAVISSVLLIPAKETGILQPDSPPKKTIRRIHRLRLSSGVVLASVCRVHS